MTISEAISKQNNNIKRIHKYIAVNVGFKNFSDEEDETQLNISHNLFSRAGTKELEELFKSLCKELNTSPDKVTYVEVVASTISETELIAMGY